MLLGSLVADRLADHRQVEAVYLGGEIGFWVRGEDGTSGVVFFRVYGSGKWDLNGSNGVIFRDFQEINFKVDECFIGAMEEVLGISIFCNKFLETGDSGVDLMLVEFDEGDALLFFIILYLAPLDDIFMVGQVLFKCFDFRRKCLLLLLLWIFLLLLDFLAHC